MASGLALQRASWIAMLAPLYPPPTMVTLRAHRSPNGGFTDR